MIKNNFWKLIIVSSAAILACGCQSLNSKFGNDRTEYANAKEAPPLKLPPSALALSTRYDIPAISSSDKDQIITSTLPPNF